MSIKWTFRALTSLLIMAAFAFSPGARANGLADKLTGTKWSWPYGGGEEKDFIVFEKGGKLKVGDSKKRRVWTVIDDSTVELREVRGDLKKGDPRAVPILKFNNDLTEATDQTTQKVLRRLNLQPAGEAAASPAPSPAASAAPTPAAKTPGSTASASPVASPASVQQPLTAAELVKAYRDSLVFVTGKEGSGSGFIATIKGANFLVTNAHVAADIDGASFKTLHGDEVRAGTPSVAVGHDIFTMAMPAGGKPLEIMDDVESNTSIGDDVVVLGNAEGQGVINTITGKIVGIGPGLVEISAPIVPGNSGSPIIHLKTGKVIGVATYGYTSQYQTDTKKVTTGNKKSKWTQVVTEPRVRRFGYRLDDVKNWQAVNWQAFHQQAGEVEDFTLGTEKLYRFFGGLAANECRVSTEMPAIPVVKKVITQWLAENAPHSKPGENVPIDAGFLTKLKSAVEGDATAVRQRLTYDYFQHGFDEQSEFREQMCKAFIEDFKDLHN